jgi:phosphate transport system permease protein
MTSSSLNISSLSRADAALAALLTAGAVLVVSLLALIVLLLFKESWPVLSHIGAGKFFADSKWYPSEGLFGMQSMLFASLAVATGAVLMAAPLGIASAIFCRFYAPASLAGAYRKLLELLAGIPSVVFGFWGLTVVVPLIGAWQPPGASMFTGLLILMLMILPTVALTSVAALEAVPVTYLNGAQALGLARKAMILEVALPAARNGVAMGIVLSMARALGETMAVVMVSGNVIRMPESLFDPVRTLTANIALEMAYAVGDHRSALYVSGLLLTAAIGALALLALRFSKGGAHA